MRCHLRFTFKMLLKIVDNIFDRFNDGPTSAAELEEDLITIKRKHCTCIHVSRSGRKWPRVNEGIRDQAEEPYLTIQPTATKVNFTG